MTNSFSIQVVKCPDCKREMTTRKTKGIKCRKCFKVFNKEDQKK